MKRLISCALAALLLVLGPPAARAQDAWPSKPVHLVVPQAAGSEVDITTRRLAGRLSALLGQPFIVDNRAGATGAIASEYVAHAPADGYTLLVGTLAPLVLNTFLRNSLRYDPAHDFAAVASIIASPFLVVANRNAPFTNLAQLISYDKANPGELSFASDGVRTLGGLTGETFNRIAGTKLVQVPYSATSAALIDTIAGRTQLAFISPSLALAAIRNGDLRAIGVTGKRVDFLPGVPSIAEAVPGFGATTWIMLVAPKATPRDVIRDLNTTVNTVQHEIGWIREQRALNGQGVKEAGDPAQLDDFLAAERSRWGGLIRSLGIQPD
ncbi:MAG: tripartite tricarboxylate transporter substrate-binding protein [Pseudomonadota bacterium]